MKAKVTSKGQITIPAFIREQAHIEFGTQLDFQLEEDRTIKVSVVDQDISSLKGIVKSKRKKPVSLRSMKKAIIEGYQSKLIK